MARALSRRLGIPYHEMDALYFAGPGRRLNEAFAEDVARIAAGPRWVIDSLGYPEVRDVLWERADTIVWLDYPRRVIMPRVRDREDMPVHAGELQHHGPGCYSAHSGVKAWNRRAENELQR
ncbi:adenylate kinase, partial [Streptomyces bomunensis]|nr:adenylate kinase [Streptomyces montanisoli]